MNADRLQQRFARAIEAEYVRRDAAYRHIGLGPEQAHLRAFRDAKALGQQVFEGLRRRGLFPASSSVAHGAAPGSEPVMEEVAHVR